MWKVCGGRLKRPWSIRAPKEILNFPYFFFSQYDIISKWTLQVTPQSSVTRAGEGRITAGKARRLLFEKREISTTIYCGGLARKLLT